MKPGWRESPGLLGKECLMFRCPSAGFVRPLALAVLGLLLTTSTGVGRAQAETTHCTPITSLPTTITSPGVYCLTSDVSLSLLAGAAIDVAASNVVVDF